MAKKALEFPVGAILDEFSSPCFAPEADLITFRPDNWQEVLRDQPIRLLLVESAWRGNDGAWQYKVASYPRNMGDELVNLVDHCRSREIPSVFWNKEDPVHFDRFIEKAKRFDHIFTSDDRCVDSYVEMVGHKRVYPLPFAAQPALHNPVVSHPRQDNVCFAGTYYASRHEERRSEMEYLLRPALQFDLHIFDRRHGYAGRDADQFLFPEPYRSAIKGRLEYDDMVKAYRSYKCFLNVNSVHGSETMCSRRVFELLACGTPVISTYSKAIEAILGTDTVLFSESEKTTHDLLRNLLHDDDFWLRQSLAGLRRVLDGNTYRNRFAQICQRLGLERPEREKQLNIVSKCSNQEELKRFFEAVERQTIKPDAIHLILKQTADSKSDERLRQMLPSTGNLKVYSDTDDELKALIEDHKSLDSALLVLLKSHGNYGQHY
ncbi:MAG: CgeB family protein, partial [bacterium]